MSENDDKVVDAGAAFVRQDTAGEAQAQTVVVVTDEPDQEQRFFDFRDKDPMGEWIDLGGPG